MVVTPASLILDVGDDMPFAKTCEKLAPVLTILAVLINIWVTKRMLIKYGFLKN